MTLCEIHLSGSPYEIGFGHGHQLKKEIQGFVDDDFCRINKILHKPISEETVWHYVDVHTREIETKAPAIVEELQGLAAGAEITYRQAVLLQVRREVMNSASATSFEGECSTFCYLDKKNGIVTGQTIDLSGDIRDLGYIFRIKPKHSKVNEIIMYGFAGLLGYMGMNSEGLAININFVQSGGWNTGLSPYLLVRQLLEENSLEGALHILENTATSSSRCLTLSQKDRSVSVEMTTVKRRQLCSSPTFHTNHFLHPELLEEEELHFLFRNSSVARLEYMQKWWAQNEVYLTPQKLFDLFSDHTLWPIGICAHSENPMRTNESVAAVVMVPKEGIFMARKGHPCTAQTFTYKIALTQPDEKRENQDFFSPNLAPEAHLLIPEMPTPNGRLHLGHIAGPFLKMDVIARSLRRSGHKAGLISGSDTYESYVHLFASKEGRSPTEVANDYHQQIHKDLSALDVEMDEYINPLDEAEAALFDATHKKLIQDLHATGSLVKRDENFLYSPSQKRYVTGCWAVGLCPVCAAVSGSYLCENCGMHYRASDLEHLEDKLAADDLEERVVPTLWLKITDFQSHHQYLNNLNIAPGFRKIANVYLEEQGSFVRLSNPDSWGIKPELHGCSDQVTFTYTFLYAFGIHIAEKWAAREGISGNPFEVDSDVIISTSFGIDNAVPYLINQTAVGNQLENYRPYTYLLPNYFFNLENEKFSTSKRHVIWAADIVEKTPAHKDSVRTFLGMTNPETGSTNFEIDHFISFHNTVMCEQFQEEINRLLNTLHNQPHKDLDPKFAAQVQHVLEQQIAHFYPSNFSWLKGYEVFHTWWKEQIQPTSIAPAYWLLKAFAIVAWPILPSTCQWLWKQLGAEGTPSVALFSTLTTPLNSDDRIDWLNPISRAELDPCLPENLKTDAQVKA